jgi:hypothetical protein
VVPHEVRNAIAKVRARATLRRRTGLDVVVVVVVNAVSDVYLGLLVTRGVALIRPWGT